MPVQCTHSFVGMSILAVFKRIIFSFRCKRACVCPSRTIFVYFCIAFCTFFCMFCMSLLFFSHRMQRYVQHRRKSTGKQDNAPPQKKYQTTRKKKTNDIPKGPNIFFNMGNGSLQHEKALHCTSSCSLRIEHATADFKYLAGLFNGH